MNGKISVFVRKIYILQDFLYKLSDYTQFVIQMYFPTLKVVVSLFGVKFRDKCQERVPNDKEPVRPDVTRF